MVSVGRSQVCVNAEGWDEKKNPPKVEKKLNTTSVMILDKPPP